MSEFVYPYPRPRFPGSKFATRSPRILQGQGDGGDREMKAKNWGDKGEVGKNYL